MQTATLIQMAQREIANERALVAEEIDTLAGPRERLLCWLLLHPFQGVEDLAVALRWHPSSVYRCVRQAMDQGVVESIAYQCHRTKATTFYYLSPAGIRTVARWFGVSPGKVALDWRQRDVDLLRWLPRLQSQRVLQQMINRFVEAWPLHYRTTRSSWKWVHEYQDPFHDERHTGASVADALLIFSEQERYHHVLFLLDPGYVGARDEPFIRQRIEALLYFKDSFEQHSVKRFPPVFILTPSEQNRAVWTRVVSAASALHIGSPLQGGIVACAYDEPLSALHHLSWTPIAHAGSWNPWIFVHACSSNEVMPGVRTWLSGYPMTDVDELKRHKSPVKGSLMQRSADLVPANTMKLSEREVVALLGLRLHRRHLDLLTTIYQHPHRRCQDIAALLYIDEATAWRSLSELTQWKCVSYDKTLNGKTFHLGDRGQRFMAALLNIPLSSIRCNQWIVRKRRQIPDECCQR